MAKVLRLTGRLDQAQTMYHKMLSRWNTTGKNRGYQLRVANRLWGQEGYPFLPEYLDLTRRSYDAELGVLDFAQSEAARREINAWVERQTADKIKELIPPATLNAATRLVLTNAIYFKGDWAKQFKKERTIETDFAVSAAKKVKVPFMRQTRTCPYAEDALLQVVEIPYKGNELSMVVLLPKASGGLAELEKSLSAEWIAQLYAKLRPEDVALQLPKFKLETSFSLKPTLEAMGMRLAFSEAADFSGISGREDLFFSVVLHKAFVEVNEQGTVAAASSMAGAAITGEEEPIIFRADHPFIFMIRDKRDGSILFLGRVVNPQG